MVQSLAEKARLERPVSNCGSKEGKDKRNARHSRAAHISF
jgi:hypothetical protein